MLIGGTSAKLTGNSAAALLISLALTYYLQTQLRSMKDTTSFAELCSLRLKKLSQVDVDATTPHAGMKSMKAFTKTSLPLLMDQSPEGLLRPCCKNLTKRDAGDGTRLSNPLTLPTLIEEHGALSTTLLATPDTHLVNALFFSSCSSSVFYFCTVTINKTQQYRISNGRRKGKKQQNDQRCNMLAKMKLEDEGTSRHGRNTRLN